MSKIVADYKSEVQRDQTERRRAAETETAEAWSRYVALLGIADPTPEDAAELVDVVARLGIPAAQLDDDTEAIAKARDLHWYHERCDEFEAKCKAAFEAQRRMMELRELREAAADARVSATTAAAHNARDAAYKLGRLALERPWLFTDDKPPRLKSDAA